MLVLQKRSFYTDLKLKKYSTYLLSKLGKFRDHSSLTLDSQHCHFAGKNTLGKKSLRPALEKHPPSLFCPAFYLTRSMVMLISFDGMNLRFVKLLSKARSIHRNQFGAHITYLSNAWAIGVKLRSSAMSSLTKQPI